MSVSFLEATATLLTDLLADVYSGSVTPAIGSLVDAALLS